MTLDAPAASALVMSPEYLIPPSAMTGICASAAAREASITAVSCGTPAPVTIRVVQIEPGPTPTFTASTPRSSRRARSGGGPDVARDELHVGELLADPADHLEHALRVAVGGVDDEHVDARIDQRRRAVQRILRDADGGPHAQPSDLVLAGVADTG